MKSPTGQKYRRTSISVEADADIDDFTTLDLVDELLERASKGDNEAKAWVREEKDAPKWSPGLVDLGWEDVERALMIHDFDLLARWLWPQVKQNWPKPKYVALAGAVLSDTQSRQDD